MRIISGAFRGKKLQGPRGRDLRPTGDRLKETLFSILGTSVHASVILDVFAGTGAIGLEAISRGAQEVVFIDSDRDAIRLIRRNLELCGVTSGYRILESDVFTSLRTLARECFTAGIAFFDPPYFWGPYRDLLETLYQTGIARPDTRVIVEHHRKAVLPETGPGYHCARIVRQGDKCLSFYGARII